MPRCLLVSSVLISALSVISGVNRFAVAAESPAHLYQQHCASCHGADRLGGMGPALLPQNLERLRRPDALAVIKRGRAATQMPAFGDKLSDEQIQDLAELIYAPLPNVPQWGLTEIRGSRVVYVDATRLPDRPVFKTDPLNLFVVVESGDHHVTILDGDTFTPLTRFPSRFALHGGPKFSPDGRFVYFASRDGWISKYDLYNLKLITEVRAGINTRNAAVSSDGRYVLVGNYLPHTLVVLDARDLSPIKVIVAGDVQGCTSPGARGDAQGRASPGQRGTRDLAAGTRDCVVDDVQGCTSPGARGTRDCVVDKESRVSAVYDAPPRKSFIVALKDIPEVWEIRYDPNAEPIYAGLVHDYRLGEGLAEKGPFAIRRIKLDDYLDDFFFDPGYNDLIGAARNGKNGQVVSLIVGRKIAEVDLTGLPHLGSGIAWTYQGRPVLATPNLKEGVVSVIDMKTWKTIKHIHTLGPGFFLRSHENTPYAWVDVFFGPNKDAEQIIDKRTLEIVKTLRPAPGKTAAHVEFTRDGRYALLSIWDMDGAIVVYDAATLDEVKRIPMKKPAGKYNVYNKITHSAGTSH